MKYPGYVYMIQCVTPAGDYYKIGVAKNPSRRVDTLQIGNPFPLRMVKHVWFADSYGAEKTLHTKLHRARVNGEWFKFRTQRDLELVETFLGLQNLCNGLPKSEFRCAHGI